MNEEANILNIERRVKAYWFVDGVPEIFKGGFLLMLAGVYSLPLLFPEGSVVRSWADVVRDPLLLLGLLTGLILIRNVKRRDTHPRTGWVTYSAGIFPWRTFLAVMVIVLALTGALVVGVTLSPEIRSAAMAVPVWMTPFLGFVMAVGTIINGIRTGEKRFYLQGILIAGLGILLGVVASAGFAWAEIARLGALPGEAALPPDTDLLMRGIVRSTMNYMAVLFAGAGVIMLVSGIIVRIRYLRGHPLPDAE